jgi:ABC-type transporter Mla subunit MlaD
VIASALKSALSTAETAVTNLANGSGSVSGTVTAIAGVATAASSLFSKATADCPS